jgi:type I restriction enzyme S subunit
MDVRPGYKQTEVGIIPEDWDALPLGDLVKLQGGYSFRSEDFCDIGVPVIRISDIQDGLVSVGSAIRHPAINISNEFCIQNGDFLVAMSGATTGKVGVYRHPLPAYQNQRVGRFVVRDETRASSEFIGHLVRSYHFTSQLSLLLEQGAQPNVSGRQIESLMFAVPRHLTEQRAIAAVLGDVDALLGALDRLIAKKRDLKQAAMQQLLTGQTRLPGFKGAWEEKTLGATTSISKGAQLHNNETNPEGYFPHYNGGMQPSSFTDHFNTPANTIAISEGGNSCGYVQFIAEPFWCGGHCYAVVPKTIDNGFLFHALKGQQCVIMGLRVGSGLPNIQKSALTSFKIRMPADLAEQTAIAEVLSDMDAELAALEQRRAKTQALKQGMMQELLTGRTRLV